MFVLTLSRDGGESYSPIAVSSNIQRLRDKATDLLSEYIDELNYIDSPSKEYLWEEFRTDVWFGEPIEYVHHAVCIRRIEVLA